jgi:Fic family protein
VDVKLAGSEVAIVWNGRRARAFVPALLRDRDFTLDARSAARTATAALEVAHAAESLDIEYEPLARLLLRSEGVASSYIEGVTAPVVDIVLAEERLGRIVTGAATWVAGNLGAISEAIGSAHRGEKLTIQTLCDWHRTLMSGSPTPEHLVGVIRSDQGWIGGTSPLDAHLVTPPPGELETLLTDLIALANREDIDAVAQAAICHAQFEIIHPFGDGNGRVGRVLVAWILVRRLSLLIPPPVSVAIAADVAGYASGLVLFRMGQHDQWITWFADAVASGGRSQRSLVARVEQIKQQWRRQLDSSGRQRRSDSSVFAALDLLPRHLVLTSQILSDELGTSRKTSLATLHHLVDAGILVEHGRVTRESAGQPSSLFVSRELLGLAGSSPLR